MENNSGRRKFLKNSFLSVGGVILASNYISCSKDIQESSAVVSFSKLASKNFKYGIASFDPKESQVIIWTRYESNLSSVTLQWQVSTTSNFDSIIRFGNVTTDATRDYTVAIEIQELPENTKFYYRFIGMIDRDVSVIGETRTFSEQHASELKLGATSCSNYELGYFNVYKEMAGSDIDIVVHLGDYIYEQGANGFGTNANTSSLNRSHKPSHELISLEDYRTRYKQYRLDSDLQLLHQKKPFICIWDDHEIANDTYKNGASAHSNSEGDFETRKQIALQVYSEFLPFTTNDESVIYRSFKFGELVQLTMLDTRLAGRDKQLNYEDYSYLNGSLDTVSFKNDWLDSSRTILGTRQKNWLVNEVNNSTTEWLLVGQQVLMGKMYYPAELVSKLNTLIIEKSSTGSISEASLTQMKNQLFELVTLKIRLTAMDSSLTETDRLRLSSVLPFNLDSWDGYPIEREEILSLLESKKTIVLAGDSHNAWHNKMQSIDASNIVNEFASASVTSAGFENLVEDSEQRQDFQTASIALVDQLSYFNSSERGFIKIHIRSGQLSAEWIMLDTILTEEANSKIDHSFIIN